MEPANACKPQKGGWNPQDLEKNTAGENDYKIEPDKIKERHSSSDETNCWSERDDWRDVERWSVLKGIIQLNTK